MLEIETSGKSSCFLLPSSDLRQTQVISSPICWREDYEIIIPIREGDF